jgi:hypothetical protein
VARRLINPNATQFLSADAAATSTTCRARASALRTPLNRKMKAMVKLRNTRHERFVQEFVTNGLYRKEAYLAVYPKCSVLSATSSAYQLLRKPEIRRRVAEIQTLTAERAGVSLYGLIREADDIQRRALAAQHHAAAVAALTVKAKLAGYWVERVQSEAVNVNYVVSDEPLSEEEWIGKHVTPE